ncbi:MAG: efflux transporter periplasmic adaptor subunit [Thiothrix nivea]|nr:MAG: efflux transporter periplasmic adaptor subunit [Thiothrix nivea]
MNKFAIFIVLSLGLTSCQQSDTVEQKPIRPAQIWEVSEQIFEHVDTYSGTIEPGSTMNLAFRVSGKLLQRLVNLGDSVTKGQEIARLDTDDSRLRADSADANLDAARSERESARANLTAVRNNYTASQGALASTQSTLTAAQGTISSARGNVAAIRASLTSTQAAADSARATHRSAQANYTAAQAAIGVAEAELQNAQSEYDRTRQLFQQKFISKTVLERDQQRLHTAQANVKSAKARAASLLEQVKSAQAQISSAQAQIKTVQAQIAAAQGEQASAQANAEALKGQVKSAAAQAEAARAQIKIAEARLKSAEAKVEALKNQRGLAKNQVGYTVLKSDSKGVVVNTLAEPGQVISAGQPIVQLAATDQPEVHIRVGEKVIQSIRPGLNADVSLWSDTAFEQSEPPKPLTATVKEISPEADRSRTWLVKLGLNNPPDNIRPGMTARVSFHTPLDKRVVWLPATALYQLNKEPAVWLVDANNQVQLQTITVKEYRNDGILVAGLNIGSKVITAGVNRLYPGQEITPVPYDGQAQPVVAE